MGSLMAGWGSKPATLKRNRSLTKEEINAFWISKKKIEEEHLRAICNVSETIEKKNGPGKKLQKSISMPFPRLKESLDTHVDTSLEHLKIKKNSWWTKSSWAFLNEPPVNEAASNKYTPQFYVTNFSLSKDAAIVV
ncbi:hypothetical protein Lal_00045656 [Lupinus albus]|uniref:Uncharacterized protein n=1 Tax=Lupinus albus TaxID=3870 RepID=A0A6A5NFD7_LUPAL|nr:hypothetical protein Lalb_Chr14g0369381 [Lupinus albus]KAF1886424.1 hypothetical protein Lal_00045656 [Lupinus albus]